MYHGTPSPGSDAWADEAVERAARVFWEETNRDRHGAFGPLTVGWGMIPESRRRWFRYLAREALTAYFTPDDREETFDE